MADHLPVKKKERSVVLVILDLVVVIAVVIGGVVLIAAAGILQSQNDCAVHLWDSSVQAVLHHLL